MKIKQSDNIQENRYKAKPIFKEEKEFIETHIPVIGSLLDDCWIVGGSTKTVYLDLYSNKPYIKFKVENGGKFIIQKIIENYLKIMYLLQCQKLLIEKVKE